MLRFCALASTFVMVACAGPNLAQRVQPDLPTGNQAAGESSCRILEDRLAPLIVDWRQDQRAEIETSMVSYLPVVAYDCQTIRLLPDCHIEGQYRYDGVDKDEQIVQLKSADELGANLPKTGVLLGAQLGGDLSKGASIDLALVMVGRYRTARFHATKADLVGECDGATHFIRGGIVGAFAMDAGTQAKVRTTAEIFGGGVEGSSISTRVQRTEAGSLAMCDTTRRGQDNPPSGCAGIYRIELSAISSSDPSSSGAAASDLNDSSQMACPKGMVVSGGKCAKAGTEALHTCAGDDPKDCQTQCDAGDAGSCAKLAYVYYEGKGAPKDASRAAPLFKRACDGGDEDSCSNLGVMYEHGEGVEADPSQAAALYKQGCDGGDAMGCSYLGFLYRDGKGVPRDLSRAVPLFKQGCDGGNAWGCSKLGDLYDNGKGVPQDAGRAAVLFKQACDGGSASACANLGFHYDEGSGVAKDVARAMQLYKQACDAGSAAACGNLGVHYEHGTGVPRDAARAAQLYGQGCDAGDANGCAYLGTLYANGNGVAQDSGRAADLYKRGCDGGSAFGCSRLRGVTAAAAAAAATTGDPQGAPTPVPAADVPFSTDAAKASLREIAGAIQSCKGGTVTGSGRVVITFAPSGKVQAVEVSGPPFEGTSTGACVAARFRAARVPAFSGSPVNVSKSFTID